jgi:hypothetical protein
MTAEHARQWGFATLASIDNPKASKATAYGPLNAILYMAPPIPRMEPSITACSLAHALTFAWANIPGKPHSTSGMAAPAAKAVDAIFYVFDHVARPDAAGRMAACKSGRHLIPPGYRQDM